MDSEVYATHSEHQSSIPPEMKALYASFQKCLGLRDKYMKRSLQWLGDNPRDRDAEFAGIDDSIKDVPCIRADAPRPSYPHTVPAAKNYFKDGNGPWNIYPPPPPPHWHLVPSNEMNTGQAEAHPNPATKRSHISGNEGFDFSQCEIPTVAIREMANWDFAVDEKGVYQVYESSHCTYASCSPLNRYLINSLQQARRHHFSIFHQFGSISWTWTTPLP